MQITVKDGEYEATYNDVLDFFLAVRQVQPLQNPEGKVEAEIQTRSYSRGNNLREIVKELSQAEVELQRYLGNLELKKAEVKGE